MEDEIATRGGPAGRSAPVIGIVVPCYNEEEVLPETALRLAAELDRLAAESLVAPASAVHFVDDGSTDRTWAVIGGLAADRPDRFRGIKLSRNRGHQNALLAGLDIAPGDALISIDADLQDDVAAIADMVRRHAAGCDIVYGVRGQRRSDTGFKRMTARLYYRLLEGMGIEIIPDHADFRLMSRRALTALRGYGEVNLFLRAIVPLLGFRSDKVYYDRSPRLAGQSKYPLLKMLALAVNGVTSFSMRPLRIITFIGIAVSLLSFFVGCWAILLVLFNDRTVPGWASVMVPITFIGGLQLFSLGVVGEYVGKIYLEVKRRPRYEVEETI